MLMGGKPQNPKMRDERIDSVKFWLIVLVIAGHVFMNSDFQQSKVCVIIWKWIYLFHMPLFIFISGYFSSKKQTNQFKLSLFKLVEPLIIWNAINLTIVYISKENITFKYLITPWWILWYLLSLIYWRLILQFVPSNILKKRNLVVCITFCISIIAGFLPVGRFLSIQRTLSFMPFFFLGYCMKGNNIYLPKKYRPLCILLLISVIVVPLFFPRYLGDLCHADPYGNAYGALKRIFTFSLAILMSIAFINICPNIPWATKQGKLTMQYYIYHALAITPIIIIVSKINIPMIFISAVIYIIILTIGIGIMLQLKFFKKLTNLSTLKK